MTEAVTGSQSRRSIRTLICFLGSGVGWSKSLTCLVGIFSASAEAGTVSGDNVASILRRLIGTTRNEGVRQILRQFSTRRMQIASDGEGLRLNWCEVESALAE